MARCTDAESVVTWRPIDTAPHDEKAEILLGYHDWSGAGFWHDGSENYWRRAGWYALDDMAALLTAKPLHGVTHWQPLPKGPAYDPRAG